MRGSVPGHTLQLLCGIDQFAYALFSFVSGVQFWVLLERAFQRHIQGEGHHLGDAVDLRIAHAHHAAHIAQHAARSHSAKGNDLRHVIRAIFIRHIGDHLASALVIEIDIQIGHGHALRVQKALEEQIVFQRVDARDIQGIRHDGARAAAAPRAHQDAVLARVPDKIPHD